MDEAEYCDRVALVNRAQLIALDSPDALKARMARPDRPEPSMEDAFVELVLAQGEEGREASGLEAAAVSNRRARMLSALVKKEALQVLRDPSSLLIAFVLPPMLLWLFANAISLDVDDVRFGVVLEGSGQAAWDLAAAYAATPYFRGNVRCATGGNWTP